MQTSAAEAIKDEYIKRISAMSDARGDKLVKLMDRCGVTGLREVTEEQARNFLLELERRSGNEAKH